MKQSSPHLHPSDIIEVVLQGYGTLEAWIPVPFLQAVNTKSLVLSDNRVDNVPCIAPVRLLI